MENHFMVDNIKLAVKEISPEELRAWFRYTIDLYRIGHLNENEFRAFIIALMVTDSNGRLFTIGMETGKWYRFQNNSWVEDTPVGKLYMSVPVDELERLEKKDMEKFYEALSRQQQQAKHVEPIPQAPVAPAAPVTPSTPIQAQPQKQTEPEIELHGTIKCAKCSAELPSNAKFCLKCGSPVEPQKRFCINCGAEIVKGAKFCGMCGTKAGE